MSDKKICEAYSPDKEVIEMASKINMDIDHLKGWSCCECNAYNGPHRPECVGPTVDGGKSWKCKHKRCDLI